MARVLFSTLNWGIGHATRDIPLIDTLLENGHQVDIIACGIAHDLLKREYPHADFFRIEDYPRPYHAEGFSSKMFIRMIPKMLLILKKEKRQTDELLKKRRYSLIISDERFGIYSKDIPSLFFSHEFRWEFADVKILDKMSEHFMNYRHRNFEKVIVPDNAPGKDSLAGKLSYTKGNKKAYYAGIISSVQKTDVKEDIDYLISISGPLEQKEGFYRRVIKQIGKLKGKKIILIGDPSKNIQKNIDSNTQIRSHATRSEMTDLMNRARFIITRSGYTTIMELAELEKKQALLIPTPGQSEQEYLSAYYEKKGWFHSVNQKDIDLPKDIMHARKYKGLPKMPKTKENRARLYEQVLSRYL